MRVATASVDCRREAPDIIGRRRTGGILLSLLILAGCASDYVPRSDAPVSAEAYRADLDSCQSSAAAARAANGAEGFAIGALWGAANGAVIGAHTGGAGIGAAIGAGVGAVIGFAEGLASSGGRFVSSCMRGKGYRPA
ncbi:MAG TPA: glycine zipper family protein [Dongiaceae bacterium]|nr:glycine zipper family protein [Dongiaceae bacterium]